MRNSTNKPLCEIAITRAERNAKDRICDMADGVFADSLKPINGLMVKGAWTTHSWAEHRAYASQQKPFTLLVPTRAAFKYSALRDLCDQVRKLFKSIEAPAFHAHGDGGMIIAIGFETDLQRMEKMTELL